MPDSSRTAVVTGGSGAIGGEICRRLASDGFNVVVHYGHNQQAADSVVADIRHSGGTAIAVQADISDEAQVIRLFEDTINQFGGIDVVVANAGTIIDGPRCRVLSGRFRTPHRGQPAGIISDAATGGTVGSRRWSNRLHLVATC